MSNNQTTYDNMMIATACFNQIQLNNDEDAYRELKHQAQNGNPWAALNLALINIQENSTKEGLINENSPGIRWLEELAKREFIPAKLKLSELYLTQNKTMLAEALLIECLEFKSPDAAISLSKLYGNEKPSLSNYLRKMAIGWGGSNIEISSIPPSNSSEEGNIEIRLGTKNVEAQPITTKQNKKVKKNQKNKHRENVHIASWLSTRVYNDE